MTASLVLFMTGCKKAPSAPDAFVVLFAGADAKVERAGKTIPLRVGEMLQAPDAITTGDGNVDLQSRRGVALRVRKFTELRLGALGVASGDGLHLRNGGIMARMDRASRAEEFNISTPTSIASVRGTTFSVSVEDGKRPIVKVMDGKVALAPRAEIKKDGAVSEFVTGAEQILDGGHSGSLPKKLEDDLLRTATLLSNSVVEEERRKALEADLRRIVRVVPVQMKPLMLTPQEEAEKDTLVRVDSEVINALLVNNKPEAKQALKQAYELRLDAALTVVEKKVNARTFKNKADLMEHYKVLEIVVTKDGKSHSGAVVAQAGDTLILHTLKGVRRLKKDRVNYIDYVQ